MSRFLRFGGPLLALSLCLAIPNSSFAQGAAGGGNFSGVGNFGLGGGLTRATGLLANPTNFMQYSQTTGVGPIRGTVRIYNQFGLLATSGGGAGGGGAFGGFGAAGGMPGVGGMQGGAGFGGGGFGFQGNQL